MSAAAFNFSPADFSYAFVSVLLEGLPFILLGTILSGLIDQFLPSRLMLKILPKSLWGGVASAAAMGMVFPMCECGIVPVIRRLLQKGLPLSYAVAYMLAAPVVNPIVLLSTYAAFRGQAPLELALLRIGVAYLVAVIAALATHHLSPSHVIKTGIAVPAGEQPADTGSPRSIPLRLGGALRVAVKDFLDVMVYFVLGVAVSSAFSTGLNQEIILPLALDDWLATASMMTLAFILSLCSTSDAFIAATFVAFPATAKLAFLVFGPMFDLKLIFIYSSVFRKRYVVGLAIGLFVLVGLICVRLTILGL
ncbi:MAG: permease [Terrimicrobiaceae bacterium]